MMNGKELQIYSKLKRWEKDLMAIPSVTALGVGGEHLYLYVEKIHRELLRTMPTEVDGIPVMLKESGRIRLFSLLEIPRTLARTERMRPAMGGISIGSPDITAGTLACKVWDKITGEPLLLTNNHVEGQDWGDKYDAFVGKHCLQPGPYDGGVDPDDNIAELLRWKRVDLPPANNLIDGSVSRLIKPDILTDEVIDLGVPGPAVEPTIGILGKKSGRTSGTNESTIESVGATVDVEGWGICRFADQIIFRPGFAEGGDSGSLTVDPVGNSLGIVFAGSEEITVVCKATNIESQLDVRFSPLAVPLEPARLPFVFLPMAIGSLAVGAVIYGKR